MISDQEHNITMTVVWAFNMLGMPVRPVVIESDRAYKGKSKQQTRSSVNLPKDFVLDYPEVLWHKTKSGFITTPIFMEWARHLRRLVGDDEPIFLLSDGHSTRTNVDTVDFLLRLNICLFLIPSNTSHALAASDQFHQHLHSARRTLERSKRVANTAALVVQEKKLCLLKAMSACKDMTSLMRSAFEHAGITQQARGVKFLRNKPAPDLPERPALSATNPDGSSTIVTPTVAEAVDASRETLMEMLRRYRSLQDSRAVLSMQIELVKAHPEALATARRKLSQSSQRFTFIGLLDETEVYRELVERKKRKLKVSQVEKRTEAEKMLGKFMRLALRTDDDGKLPKMAELKAYLGLKRVHYEKAAKRHILLGLAAVAAGLDVPEARRTTADCLGSDASDDESESDDEDNVYVDFYSQQGSTSSLLQIHQPVASAAEQNQAAAAQDAPAMALFEATNLVQPNEPGHISHTSANGDALQPPKADMDLIHKELRARTDLVKQFWDHSYALATAAGK